MGLRDVIVKYLNLGPQIHTGRQTHSSLPIGKLRETFYADTPSNPFWIGDLSTHHLPSYGWTYRPYDVPFVKFSVQKDGLQQDEDVQLSLNTLVSSVVGGEHYWKAKTDELAKYMTKFSTEFNFDEFDYTLAMEMLWFGNSFWKVRDGYDIGGITSVKQLQHLPISSCHRAWWDRERIPRVYEFRGAEFNGYFRAEQIMHFKYNPIGASAFGTGLGTAASARILYFEDTADGAVERVRESLLSMKYGIQNLIYKSAKRYVTRNVYQALDSTPTDREDMKADLRKLDVGEDFVTGKKVEVKELGSATRNYDPAAFMDTILGPLTKALQSMRGRQAGESQHTYANAEQASLLDELGLAAFPLVMKRQLLDYIFKPWYAFNPTHDKKFGGGLVTVPWEFAEFDLNFGKIQKKDLTAEQTVALIDVGMRSKSIRPIEARKAIENAGLPIMAELTDEILSAVMEEPAQENQNQPLQMESPADQKLKEAKAKFLETLVEKKNAK